MEDYLKKLLKKIDKNMIKLEQNYIYSIIVRVLKYGRKFRIVYIFCINTRIIKNKYISIQFKKFIKY